MTRAYYEPRTTGTKVCPGPCKDEKHVLAFAADHRRPDGLCVMCRDCVATSRKPRLLREQLARVQHNLDMRIPPAFRD